MKTSLKKLVAGASLVALIAINSVNAMSLTGSSTSLSLTGQTAGTNYSGATVNGSLNLDVTAQVLPTLSFDIGTGAIALGVLSASTVSTGAMDVILSTNAANGANVTVSSANNGLTSGTDVIEFTGTGIVAGTEGYNLTVDSANNIKGAMPTITTPLVGVNTSTQIMAVDNPTDTAKVKVQVNASIDNITPAGNYSIQHVFTVTGSF